MICIQTHTLASEILPVLCTLYNLLKKKNQEHRPTSNSCTRSSGRECCKLQNGDDTNGMTQVFVCVQLYIPTVLKEKQNSTPKAFLPHYVSHEAINSTKQLFFVGRDAFREDFFSLFSHFNNQRTISTSPMNSFTISSPEITLSDLSTMNISWSTGLSIIIASFLITFSIFLSGSTFTE